MCPFNALIFILIACLVPAIIYWHISISLGQRQGDISGSYQLTPLERIFDIIFFLIIIMLAVVFVSVDESYKAHPSISTSQMIVFSIFIGSFLFLMYVRYTQTRAQIRHWMAEQGYVIRSFHWCIFDNPWARDQSGIFDGQSDSQTSYKIEVVDREGKPAIAYILWGSYFGLSALTGSIPVQLVWNKVARLEQMRKDALKDT